MRRIAILPVAILAAGRRRLSRSRADLPGKTDPPDQLRMRRAAPKRPSSARAFAMKLTESLGQQVDRGPRVSAPAATLPRKLPRAGPADGYTLADGRRFFWSTQPEPLQQALLGPAKGISRRSPMLTAAPLILCVHPSLPGQEYARN